MFGPSTTTTPIYEQGTNTVPFTFGQTPLSLPPPTSGQASPTFIFRLQWQPLTPVSTPFSFSSFPLFGTVHKP